MGQILNANSLENGSIERANQHIIGLSHKARLSFGTLRDKNIIGIFHVKLANHTLSDRVFLEQVKLLYEKNDTVLIGTIGIALTTLIVLWQPIGAIKMVAWFSLTLLITAGRVILGARKKGANISAENARWWANAFVVGAAANALSWSIVPVFFLLPEQPIYVLFVTCLYAGYISGSVASTSVYFPAFLGFALPLTVLCSARVFMEPDPVYLAIGIMIWFYAIASYSFAKKNNRSILEAIELKFENTDLLEELREQRDTAEQAVLAKNHFLAATSHDLRQPLHALGLFVEAMESEIGEHSSGRTLDKIRESTDALTKQLHGMLDLSTLDAGVVEYHPRHLALGPLISRLADDFRVQAVRKRLIFEIDEPESVVFCDENALERILRNLISNAINHTDVGNVSINVVKNTPKCITIKISDTGSGIPADQFEKIYVEYHQLRNPGRDRRQGLGLGLAIVKRLCLLGALDLDLESTAGSGTTFSLTVPEGDQEQMADLLLPVNLDKLDGAHVVVIDDDEDIISSTTNMLQRWGCVTLGALRAEDALLQLHEENAIPDIVILDFRLASGATGLEAMVLFKKEFAEQLRYIIITGETMPSQLKAVNDAGIPILHKPVRPEELRSTLNYLLGEQST